MKLTQHDPGLHPWLADYGCSTLCLWALAGLDLSVSDANSLYLEMVNAGCYTDGGSTSSILLWVNACAFLNRKYGTNLRFINAVENSYQLKPGESVIEHYYISLSFPDHFVIGVPPTGYDPSGTGNAWDHGIKLNRRIFTGAKI